MTQYAKWSSGGGGGGSIGGNYEIPISYNGDFAYVPYFTFDLPGLFLSVPLIRTPYLQDTSGITSIDIESRYLVNNVGNYVFNWTDQIFYDVFTYPTADMQQRFLYKNPTASPIPYFGGLTLDWQGGFLTDPGPSKSIGWIDRLCFDRFEQTSIDYDNRNLIVSDGSTGLNWQSRILYDSNNVSVLNWSLDNVKFPYILGPIVPIIDSAGALNASSTTPTQLGYLNSVTSSVQGQLNAITNNQNTSFRANNSSTALSGTLATIVWTTINFDTRSGYSAGTYTVPTGYTGKYQVQASLRVAGTFTANQTIVMQIQVGGTAYSAKTIFMPAGSTGATIDVHDLIALSAGNTVRVQVSSTGTGLTITSSTSENFFSLTRVAA